MLTWTSVVATGPTDDDIAAAVAGRSALVIRPLIEFAPLRRAMGLPTVDDRTDEVQAAAATVASTVVSSGRRRATGSAKTAAARTTPRSTSRTAATKRSKPRSAGASAKPTSTKQRSAATAATARTPDTAAA